MFSPSHHPKHLENTLNNVDRNGVILSVWILNQSRPNKDRK